MYCCLKIHISNIFFFLITLFSFSQKLEVSVSQSRVQTGQMFEIRFSANGGIRSFTPPSFRDFEVLGGPNHSQSVQIINGNYSQSYSISYYLVARKEGKYTIGPARAVIDGNEVSSAPVTIEVVKGNEPVAGNSASPQDEEEPVASASVGEKDCFIQTILSKNKCMVGEPLIISQKIYSRYPIVSIEKFDSPSYEGVWSQTLQTTSGNQLQVEVLNGKQYYSFEIYRHQITPARSGKLTFKPLQGTIIIRKVYQGKPRNIWEHFFGAQSYQDERVIVRGRPAELNVMDLPQNGKPDNFSGAIGEFQFKAELNKKEIPQNEALNLKITISGKGNLQVVESPKPVLPESFEQYEPRVNETGGSKTFEFLIIPRSEGEYTIHVPPFSYYSLEKKQYITIPSYEFPVKVLPGNQQGGPVVYQSMSPVKNDIPTVENDIRYIKKFPFEIYRSEHSFTGSSLWWSGVLFPWACLLTVMLVLYRRKKEQLNPGEYSFRRASRTAFRLLEKASRHLEDKDATLFYQYVMQGIQHYLCSKLKIGLSEFHKETTKDKLTRHHVSPQTAHRIMELYENAEMARYAPGALSSIDKKQYLSEIRTILSQTEKEFQS
jgi:hypothetical protein